MKKKSPLISCICITNNRPLLLQRAIACFERQDYANKELVISYPKSDVMTKNVINQISEMSDIKILRIERNDNENLGTARNSAIQQANGEYICIWDDDDWYNINRISHQYNAISKGPFKASVLTHILMFDFETKESFLSGYRHWEGTLLCEKSVMSKYLYLDKEKGEDTSVLHELSSNNLLFHIKDASQLYIYIYHGKNTWGENHFNTYFLQSQPLGEKISKQVTDLTNLEYYIL